MRSVCWSSLPQLTSLSSGRRRRIRSQLQRQSLHLHLVHRAQRNRRSRRQEEIFAQAPTMPRLFHNDSKPPLFPPSLHVHTCTISIHKQDQGPSLCGRICNHSTSSRLRLIGCGRGNLIITQCAYTLLRSLHVSACCSC
jgi:hypothetical protein